MKGIIFESFKGQPKLATLPDPTPETHGVVIKVEATGVCRSDWHGWMGHDTDIVLPHVPGHELAGTISAIGRDVTRWKVGDRVTVPFVAGCGQCPTCHSGNQQVCEHQMQPGFTHWGSFAEYVGIHQADLNLVRLPENLDFATAAALGCRFVTSFRAVVDQGKATAGQWVAVTPVQDQSSLGHAIGHGARHAPHRTRNQTAEINDTGGRRRDVDLHVAPGCG